jgi:hypothetical protein
VPAFSGALLLGHPKLDRCRREADSLVPLESCVTQPVRQLSGDAGNLGALARAYHGVPLDSVRNQQGVFVA